MRKNYAENILKLGNFFLILPSSRNYKIETTLSNFAVILSTNVGVKSVPLFSFTLQQNEKFSLISQGNVSQRKKKQEIK